MTTVQAPPPAAVRPTLPLPEPERGPRSRRWLLGFWAVVFVAFLAVHPGRQTFDTKLGVTTDPWQFLSDLGQLWHDRGGFGGIQDQYVGYAFPMLPFYGLAKAVHLPVWLAERLWLSLVVSVAFWGALRLAERLRIGSPAARLLGAAAYALWPTFTIVVGSTSAAVLPGAFLPWVLLPLTNDRTSARLAALRSALLVPFMGGVNAAATLASLLPVGLYLLSRPRGPRQRKLIAWWVPGVLLATAWWVVPLLMLALHGENFLPYVETSQTTTDTMSATESLRGAGNWVAYLHFGDAWLPAGWTVATAVVTIVCSALAAALGLAGLARRDLPERRWLVLTALSVVLVTLAGYGGAFGAPFHGTVQDWLDGGLVPFRNIYKFQTGLALALVFGLMHLVGVATQARGARPVRGRRFAPLIAAVLVLPGLAWPYLNGSILQPGSFRELPKYWHTTADWLEKYSPDSRALVVPATAHGIYTWGSPIDQPLDVLADSRWAQRDYVPFGTPGNRRAMDAVEQALMTGGQVPGLRDYLARAGLYYVVVRNDLDPDQIGAVPTATVKRTLEESGFRRVTGFGPVTTGGTIANDTPVQVEGLYPRQRAVEIYAPGKGGERPGQAGLKPVSNTAVVSGGPESLLPLSADRTMRDRPTVLAGDNHPGVGAPGLQAVGDGLRRADTRFGLVNTNTSYTYTRDQRNESEALQDPGEKPHQILPTKGISHQTVAELRGARDVTASSSGNWLFHLPQYDPVNAFDGDPDTAWAEGSAGSPKGEWIKARFRTEVSLPSTLKVTPLPQEGVRAAATRVRVETAAGSATSFLQPNGTKQTIKSPSGSTSWVKLTILQAQVATPGLTGAGFSEIAVPGVKVTKLLRLPRDATAAAGAAHASATTYALHRSADASGLSPAAGEPGLHRRFTTDADDTYEVGARAVARPGPAFDRLLYRVAPEPKQRIVATADSTARLGGNLSPRNLTDGDLTTAWIAGAGANPVIHLKWPGKVPVGEVVLPGAGGLSTRPERIEISSPDGAAVAGVDENGVARFQPITTDRLDITITQTAPLKLHNPVADEKLQLPVGLTEVYVPALEQFRTEQPDPAETFRLGCGKGPELTVDGRTYATSVRGTVGDLTQRRPVKVTLCRNEKPDTELDLSAGRHDVDAADTGAFAVTDVSLTRGTPGTVDRDTRELRVKDWLGDRRELTVGAGAASYLTTYENENDGWKATLNGKELTSLRLDGWQQGWLVPEGEGGTIKLSYEPATVYEAGLIGGGVAVLVLAVAALVMTRRRETNADAPTPPPAGPSFLLGTVVLTLVVAAVGGLLALLVPVLALLAWRRHALLVPLAFLAMAGAGIAAATGAGEPVAAEEGAFGRAAQLLAVVAVVAALVSVRDPAAAAGGPGGSGGPDGPGGPGGPDGPGGPGGSQPAQQHGPAGPSTATLPLGPDRDLGPAPDTTPTAPLPQRRRGGGKAPEAVASGPTVSARGPAAAQPEPAPPVRTSGRRRREQGVAEGLVRAAAPQTQHRNGTEEGTHR